MEGPVEENVSWLTKQLAEERGNVRDENLSETGLDLNEKAKKLHFLLTEINLSEPNDDKTPPSIFHRKLVDHKKYW